MFTHFNHSQLRRYIVAFGQLFNNVVVTREQGSTEVQRMVVPLEYGPKERWFVRLVQDPNLTRGVGQILPRMTYEVSSIGYDGSRKLNTLDNLTFPSTEQRKRLKMYVGVPYTLTFDLSIMTKLQADGMQIVEQILPYFTPDLTFALQPVPEIPLVDQVPLTLLSVSHTDNYEGEFEKRRAVVWSLGFSMKVFFYGPSRKQSRIEEIMVDIYNSPVDAILDPPELLETESTDNFITEDESGHVLTEETPDFYGTLGRVARVDVEATPADQDPNDADGPQSTTTITEYDGDVVRTRTGEDENL